MINDESVRHGVRLDVWLDVACLCKTRSEAQKACKGGKVEVNGQSAKAQRPLKVGDVVIFHGREGFASASSSVSSRPTTWPRRWRGRSMRTRHRSPRRR